MVQQQLTHPEKQTNSLLLVLDSFTQIKENDNEDFFRLVEDTKSKVVIITTRPFPRESILNTPVSHFELMEFKPFEARILLYSSIDLN